MCFLVEAAEPVVLWRTEGPLLAPHQRSYVAGVHLLQVCADDGWVAAAVRPLEGVVGGMHVARRLELGVWAIRMLVPLFGVPVGQNSAVESMQRSRLACACRVSARE